MFDISKLLRHIPLWIVLLAIALLNVFGVQGAVLCIELGGPVRLEPAIGGHCWNWRSEKGLLLQKEATDAPCRDLPVSLDSVERGSPSPSVFELAQVLGALWGAIRSEIAPVAFWPVLGEIQLANPPPFRPPGARKRLSSVILRL